MFVTTLTSIKDSNLDAKEQNQAILNALISREDVMPDSTSDQVALLGLFLGALGVVLGFWNICIEKRVRQDVRDNRVSQRGPGVPGIPAAIPMAPLPPPQRRFEDEGAV